GALTPQVQSVQMNTSSSPISFSVSAGTAAWLQIAPATGLVMPGAPVTLQVTANPSTLPPAAVTSPYKAKITVTATGATNKTLTIPVYFVVTYQTPTVTAIWPGIGQVGGPATTVTIFGTNFAAATVAKIAATTPVGLKTTYYSPTAISAVIPAPQLVAGTDLTIYASNPAPGGDSTTTVAFTFHQQVDAVVSAASYLSGGAPGDLVTLFGQNIGPPVPSLLSVAAGFVVTTTPSGFTVTVGASAGPPIVPGFLAPIVYASQNQITVQIPYEVTLGLGQAIQVTNGGAVNASGTVDVAATAPGIFTLDSSGSGQAAALNHDGTLNSGSNPEKIGKDVTLYLTGEGDYAVSINPRTGFVMTTAALAALWPAPLPLPLNPPPTVTIGGKAATVAYAGPFVGGMLGVLQLNVTIPAGITTGAAVPVVVTIGGADTHLQNVTIAAKP
ncbi:MAG TPA: hypothetical protein VEU62_17310, partial [Bryobacterales bacterium]|nr:hypothetical protein [Bryobacterales bacterium]